MKYIQAPYEVTLQDVVTPNQFPGQDLGFGAKLLIDGRFAAFAYQDKADGLCWYKPLLNDWSVPLLEKANDYYQSQPGSLMTLSSAIFTAFVEHELLAAKFAATNYDPAWETDSLVVFNGKDKLFRVAQLKMSIDNLLAQANGEKMIYRVLKHTVLPSVRTTDLFLSARLPARVLVSVSRYFEYALDHPLERAAKLATPGKKRPRQF